jgi:preprotein translocase subunit YajC
MEYLMFVTQALAETAGGGGAVGGPAGLLEGPVGTILPFALIFVIMYFILWRPQQQKQRQHRELIANIRRGDTVVTSGGLIGKVAKVVDESELQVDLAEGVRVRVIRSTIAEVRAKGEPVKDNG